MLAMASKRLDVDISAEGPATGQAHKAKPLCHVAGTTGRRSHRHPFEHEGQHSCSANAGPSQLVVLLAPCLQDTFQTNLNKTHKEEAESAETFQALRKAKETEIHATEEAIFQRLTSNSEAAVGRPLCPRRRRRPRQTRRRPGRPRRCKIPRPGQTQTSGQFE